MKKPLPLLLALLLVPFASLQANEPDAPPTYAMGKPIPKLQLLPKPVQVAIKKKAGKRHVARVVRDNWKDTPAFRVTFREKGPDPEIYVADDGTLLTPEEVRPSLARTLFATRFEDTPAEVQKAIRQEIGNGKIVRIEKEKRDEGTCYRVECAVTPRSGKTLVIADSGQVIEGRGADVKPAGATASTD